MKKILLLVFILLASFNIMGQSYSGSIIRTKEEKLNDECCSSLLNDIAMIKVIKEPFVGSIGCNSAVAIYTLKAEEGEDE